MADVYPQPVNFVKNLLYGGLAGSVGSLCTFPIDTAKTRAQMESKKAAQAGLEAVKTLNAAQMFREVLRKEGARALYRGLPVQLIGIIPEKALKLSVNDSARYFLRNKETGSITLRNEAIAGATAGFCQVVVTAPMEQLKIRMQQQAGAATQESLSVVIKSITSGGLASVYKGLCATLCRDVFFSVIYFPLFSRCKKLMANQPDGSQWDIFHRPGSNATERDLSKRVNLFGTFVSGLVAGGVSAFLSTPFDVIKTRLQAKEGAAQYEGSIKKCVQLTLAQDGPKAFLKGAGARVALIGPLFGIVLFTYEFVPRLLGQS